MDPTQFFRSSRVTIVAGKGGVGKTTVSAALASCAASVGLRTQIVEIEGKSGLAGLFGRPNLTYDEIELAPMLTARTLTPDDALVEYLADHGLKRISKRLAESGALDMVATATPGIKDVLILGKIKQLERAGDHDVIIVDAPAAGHAISFLRSARGLLDAVKVGPIETQAREVMELLTDAARCQVLLVTLPEETPVNELAETAFALEDQIGVALAPVVVNGLYPDIEDLSVTPRTAARSAGVRLEPGVGSALGEAAAFWTTRRDLQLAQVERLGAMLPLEQLHLPFLFEAAIGDGGLERLSEEIHRGLTALADLGTTP